MISSLVRPPDDLAPRLSLIRGFELRVGDDVVPVAYSAQRLVAFVALQHRAVRRLYVSGVLWSDTSERHANSSLRSALWRTPSAGGHDVIQASSTHLWLNPQVDVDVQSVVEEAITLVEGDGTECLSRDLAGRMRQFGDDLLPGWYEDWVLVERERFRQLRLHALERLCEVLTDAGRYALALDAGLAAVACEPLRESAQRQVIRAHLKEGNLTEAIRQYRSYAQLLSSELGAEPSESMKQLLEGMVGIPLGCAAVTSP